MASKAAEESGPDAAGERIAAVHSLSGNATEVEPAPRSLLARSNSRKVSPCTCLAARGVAAALYAECYKPVGPQ